MNLSAGFPLPVRAVAAFGAASCLIASSAVLAATSAPLHEAGGGAAAAPDLPKLTVQQIVERNVAARGGLAAWHSVRSIAYSGTLDAGRARPDNGLNPGSRERLLDKPGKSTRIAQAPEQNPAKVEEGVPVTLPYTLYMQRPNKQRMEVKFQNETLVQVFDGKNGWKLQPYLHRGGAIPFSAEEIKKAQQFQEIDGALVDFAAKGSKVALDGTDTVDGRPAYRLKLTLRTGDTRRIWIDAESFLDVQIDGTRRLNGRPVAEYTALRDFRSVGGVVVPYRMETRTEGLPEREKIVVEKVALNPKLDDTLFGKPN
jgi:hypothetical protein